MKRTCIAALSRSVPASLSLARTHSEGMIQGKPNLRQHVVSCCGEAGTTPWNQPLDIGFMRSWKACMLEFLCEIIAELVINGMDEMGLAKTAPELEQ